jgi:glycosyltransferase involved in cell wall biosynthesis
MLKISVVTVCYNHAQFVADTIQSVLTQDYPNIEYIVIDGGSTDGSAEIIKKYSDRLAYWCSEPDGGQTPGLIKGFSKATGDVFCWINSDDLLAPGTLSEVANFFKKHPDAMCVTGDTRLIDGNGRQIRIQRQLPFCRFFWLNDHNYIAQSSTFWRRKLYEKVGGLNSEFNLAMDGDLFARFSDEARLHKVRRIWSSFRVYAEQKTTALRGRGREEDEIIRRRYYPHESVLVRKVRRGVARPLRVLCKLFYGCYFS